MTWQPDDGKTGKLALKIAANLAVSSVMLGLPPAGCGLVISCPETHKTDVRHIFRVLQNAGCGPFIPLEGISVEEMRAVCNPDALLCWAEYDGYATGPSFVALSEAVRSHEQAYARFSPRLNFSLSKAAPFAAQSLFLDKSLKGIAGIPCGNPMERLRIFSDMAGKIGRWSEISGLPPEWFAQALCAGKLLEACTQDDINVVYDGTKTAVGKETEEKDRHRPLFGLASLLPDQTALRTEHDSLGEVSVPSYVLYGAQTERSRQNFAVSGLSMGENKPFIQSLGRIKRCAALANKRTEALDADKADAIIFAAWEMENGVLDGNFPVDWLQGGGGVAMNMNEVIANRASELLGGTRGSGLVHPNDDVNMCHYQ